MSIRYIGQKLAQQIDEELMSSAGAFSLDQLMELAGSSCAQASGKSYPPKTHKKVLVCCGPGNQGGDGLVAARHSHHFHYTPTSYYPKPGKKEIYQRLSKQCTNSDIPVSSTLDEFHSALKANDVVMDAIFGFSFEPPVRAPFDRISDASAESKTPIVSVDMPSGWNVEKGRQELFTQPDDQGKSRPVKTIDPEVLVSLTVPKEGAKEFKGKHWLGGRFVSDSLDKKYDLNIPDYPGFDEVVESSPGNSKL